MKFPLKGKDPDLTLVLLPGREAAEREAEFVLGCEGEEPVYRERRTMPHHEFEKMCGWFREVGAAECPDLVLPICGVRLVHLGHEKGEIGYRIILSGRERHPFDGDIQCGWTNPILIKALEDEWNRHD